MSLVVEDFDISDEEARIYEALYLNEDIKEDNKLIDIISNNDNDIKSAAKEESDEINSLLGINNLIDMLEKEDYDSAYDLDVNVKDNPELHINMIDKNTNDLQLKVHDDSKDDDIKLQIHDTNDNDIAVKLKDSLNKGIVDSIDDKVINLNLRNDTKDNNDTIVNVSLKNDDKSDGANNNITIKVNDTDDDSSYNNKIAVFIKKRDEIISNPDPNFQLSVCIKTVLQLRDSLERLINHIPNETILVKTKYVISNILDTLLTDCNMILKDSKKLKKIIYRVFDMVISINQYIVDKYDELENGANDTTKDYEDRQISKQITDIENSEENINNKNESPSDNDNTNIDKTISNRDKIKRPNINKQKI